MNVESRFDMVFPFLGLETVSSTYRLSIEYLALMFKRFFKILAGKRLIAELGRKNFDVG